MDILEFLTRLDANLNISMNSFKGIQKNKVKDLIGLHNILQKNAKNLYKYLEYMKQLEHAYFYNLYNENERFMLPVGNGDEFDDKNLKKKFKNDLVISANIHKLKKNKEAKDKLAFPTKELTALDDCDISHNQISIPIIKNIKDLQPMFYWYEGDKLYKKGVYTCVSQGFYIRVPFPDVVSVLGQNYKTNSMPCKYETKEACTAQKKKISEIYNTEARTCSYVHRREKFVKLGSIYKCSKEDLGAHSTLKKDLEIINLCDVKRVLMHSLSDSLISAIWYQNKFKDGDLILNNIEYY